MDEKLRALGYQRKQIPKDGNCLFRAISEQVYGTQNKHACLRNICADHIVNNSSSFEQFLDCNLESYVERLRAGGWGGHMEIKALSVILNLDVYIFSNDSEAFTNVTENDMEKKIFLCYVDSNHFDALYTSEYMGTLAHCQSLVYTCLYKNIFGMEEVVDEAVDKMLYNKDYAKKTKGMRSLPRQSLHYDAKPEIERHRGTESYKEELKKKLANGIPPFPYEVAKALDKTLYGNVDADLFNDEQRERQNKASKILAPLEEGNHCWVKLEGFPNRKYQALIQEMAPNNGRVELYIIEFGKKVDVPYENLERISMVPYNPVEETKMKISKVKVLQKPNSRGRSRRRRQRPLQGICHTASQTTTTRFNILNNGRTRRLPRNYCSHTAAHQHARSFVEPECPNYMLPNLCATAQQPPPTFQPIFVPFQSAWSPCGPCPIYHNGMFYYPMYNMANIEAAAEFHYTHSDVVCTQYDLQMISMMEAIEPVLFSSYDHSEEEFMPTFFGHQQINVSQTYILLPQSPEEDICAPYVNISF